MQGKIYTEPQQDPVPHLIYVIELDEPIVDEENNSVRDFGYLDFEDFCYDLKVITETGIWPS